MCVCTPWAQDVVIDEIYAECFELNIINRCGWDRERARATQWNEANGKQRGKLTELETCKYANDKKGLKLQMSCIFCLCTYTQYTHKHTGTHLKLPHCKMPSANYFVIKEDSASSTRQNDGRALGRTPPLMLRAASSDRGKCAGEWEKVGAQHPKMADTECGWLREICVVRIFINSKRRCILCASYKIYQWFRKHRIANARNRSMPYWMSFNGAPPFTAAHGKTKI